MSTKAPIGAAYQSPNGHGPEPRAEHGDLGLRTASRSLSPLFHRIFLGSVKQFGRVFEAGMIGFYNIFSGHFTKDLLMAPRMLLKGKIGLLPSRNRHRKELKEMFAKAKELETT